MNSSENAYLLFDSPLGACGIAWSERGLTRFLLPGSDQAATEARLTKIATKFGRASSPVFVRDALARVRNYLAGDQVDLRPIPVDLSASSPFYRKVYAAAREIGWGKTVTYGELADRAGSPAAARAVGQALSRNPVAIIIPCHRILASGNKVGGFTAFGGTSLKTHLLEMENFRLESTELARP